ncbi:hypothetical protein I4U23_014915 [Adineta vaga]|nr:hypothetical protein I4U23_014915 [Adineta vaga]
MWVRPLLIAQTRICGILDVKHNYVNKEIDNAGNTALLFAIKYASPLTVQLLLKQGAQPDQPNSLTLQTPLSLLAAKTYDTDQTHQAELDLEIAIHLLDHDAFVDKPSPFKFIDEEEKECTVQEIPLMTAVRTRNLAMATLLVDRKANVNYLEKHYQNRPVHLAIMNGDEAMFDLLENAGASCRSVVTDGNNTLLHWFCSNKANDEQRSLLKKLIDIGCNVNAENDGQQTPLMLAAKLNMVNTCEILLNARADTDIVDHRGHRAIDLAKLGSDCFRLLQHARKVQQKKAQSYQNIERMVCKKPLLPRRQLSLRTSEPIEQFQSDENKMKRYLSTIVCEEEKKIEDQTSFCISNKSLPEQENDTKYKRKWNKLLQKRQILRQTKHLSLHSIDYYS